MRVAILTQYYPPEVGAPQVRLSIMAEQFAEYGHKVIVLCAMPNYPKGRLYPGYGGLWRREEDKGVVIFRSYIYPTKKVGWLPRLISYLSFVLSSLIVGVSCLPKADYLITESPPLFLGISGYLLSRVKGIPWIFNLSDLWPETPRRLGMIKAGLILQIARFLEAFFYRRAWLVTGQSKEIMEGIRLRCPGAAGYYLPNGVDIRLFETKPRSPDIRKELAKDKDCIAVYAGLHGACQGLEQILRAAARLKDVNELGIVLVGDGPEKEKLIGMARSLKLSNVRFLDPYPYQKMPALLASADIALVPLKVRLPGAVPSKLYEAMAAGLPIVLMAEGEPAEILRQAQCGVAVSCQDDEALAGALRALAKDCERRRQLGENGRQEAAAQFDRRVTVDRFINFLKERL